jgi:hypothetical protein
MFISFIHLLNSELQRSIRVTIRRLVFYSHILQDKTFKTYAQNIFKKVCYYCLRHTRIITMNFKNNYYFLSVQTNFYLISLI